MDNHAWFEKAKAKIVDLEPNKTFEAKQLFEGVEWEMLSKGERTSFGRFFANEVREGNIPNIVALERGKNNHSRYKKVED